MKKMESKDDTNRSKAQEEYLTFSVGMAPGEKTYKGVYGDVAFQKAQF